MYSSQKPSDPIVENRVTDTGINNEPKLSTVPMPYEAPAPPSQSTFQLTIAKDEGYTKDPTVLRLDFRDDTTLVQARKLAVDLRRALKPYYTISLKVDEDYSARET